MSETDNKSCRNEMKKENDINLSNNDGSSDNFRINEDATSDEEQEKDKLSTENSALLQNTNNGHVSERKSSPNLEGIASVNEEEVNKDLTQKHEKTYKNLQYEEKVDQEAIYSPTGDNDGFPHTPVKKMTKDYETYSKKRAEKVFCANKESSRMEPDNQESQADDKILVNVDDETISKVEKVDDETKAKLKKADDETKDEFCRKISSCLLYLRLKWKIFGLAICLGVILLVFIVVTTAEVWPSNKKCSGRKSNQTHCQLPDNEPLIQLPLPSEDNINAYLKYYMICTGSYTLELDKIAVTRICRLENKHKYKLECKNDYKKKCEALCENLIECKNSLITVDERDLLTLFIDESCLGNRGLIRLWGNNLQTQQTK